MPKRGTRRLEEAYRSASFWCENPGARRACLTLGKMQRDRCYRLRWKNRFSVDEKAEDNSLGYFSFATRLQQARTKQSSPRFEAAYLGSGHRERRSRASASTPCVVRSLLFGAGLFDIASRLARDGPPLCRDNRDRAVPT